MVETCGTVAVLGVGVVHSDDLVARPQSRAERGRPFERPHHNHFALGRAHPHPDAVIVAGLAFPQQRIRLWIEEIRMRIECAKHARNGASVNGAVRIHLVGEVRLHGFVNLGEFLDARVHIRFGLSRKIGMDRAVEKSQQSEPQAPAGDAHFCEDL